MNPEMLSEVLETQKQFDLLTSASTIPHEVEQAFRARLRGLSDLVVSPKGATSESQTVQENGIATYGVLKNPDLFLQVIVGGVVHYVPAFL